MRIANVIFIIFIIFFVFFVICSVKYRDKHTNDLSGQSERQKNNSGYNTDFFP